MNNLQRVLANIEKFKQKDALTEPQNQYGFVYEPLNRNYGFMVFSEEKYNPYLEKLSDYQYKHRYYYYERFNNEIDKNVIFVMFNPSSACPTKDDPTIKNCRILAEKQYGSMEIINVFSERNPKVKEIQTDDNTINFEFIKLFLNERKDTDVVIAWGYGKEKEYKEQIDQVKELLTNNDKYKITVNEDAFKSIKDLDKHPAPSCWSAFNGFKNAAELTKY